MEYVVDLQGFRRSRNLFVLKEAAIIAVADGTQPGVFHFQAPCKWSKLLKEEQEVNRWLEAKFHGIPWNSGYIPHKDVIRVLRDSLKYASKIYVKGLEKKRWLEEILPEKIVCDMEDLSCPSLKNLHQKGRKMHCPNHPLRRNAACAMRNAQVLKDWIFETRDCCDFDEVDAMSSFSSFDSRFVSPLRTRENSPMREEIQNSMYN